MEMSTCARHIEHSTFGKVDIVSTLGEDGFEYAGVEACDATVEDSRDASEAPLRIGERLVWLTALPE